MILTHFKFSPVDVLYRLFKTYCMPLYGCQLLDLADPSTDRLFVTWRKCIRSILRLPYRTHSNLLPYICDDCSAHNQICSRFIKFFRSLTLSNNTLISTCSMLALQGSTSRVSNSLSYISHTLNINRSSITNLTSYPCTESTTNDDDIATAQFVSEILDERWFSTCFPCCNNFFKIQELNKTA
jgi:hypothetical protein